MRSLFIEELQEVESVRLELTTPNSCSRNCAPGYLSMGKRYQSNIPGGRRGRLARPSLNALVTPEVQCAPW